ncbi:MAG TPA: TetR/AcrR family transcriptional regulator [Pseudonocardia sp.]
MNTPRAKVADSQLVMVRREQIARAAKKLFSRQGFARTSIKDIAASAGISVGLVYEYVRTKEDILDLMLETSLRRYHSGLSDALELGDNPLERLVNGIYFYVREVDRDRDGITVWYRETAHLTPAGKARLKTAAQAVIDLLASAIQAAAEAGLVREDVDPVTTATIVELSCHGRALKPYLMRPAADFAAAVVSTVLLGLATPAGQTAYAGYRTRLSELH